MTRWAEKVTPGSAWTEYPRPQLAREAWQNLNGLWDHAVAAKDAPRPENWAGRILVPFPIESALSGVMQPVQPDQALWYRRSFDVPADWGDKRILLHFGAVDWEATVFVNDAKVGSHRGGYDPFTLDITEHIARDRANELMVRVWDPGDASTQPRGKQVLKPEGIWYTPTTGIWQTVWLEPVPISYLDGLVVIPRLESGEVEVQATLGGVQEDRAVWFEVLDGSKSLETSGVTMEKVFNTTQRGGSVRIPIRNPKPWTPDSPFLYRLRATVLKNGAPDDVVESYFGMREIRLGKDEAGVTRLLLNGESVFQIGPLDQGFWPDGLYTPPSDAAMRYDIEVLKDLGFNMLRKHVKVECDRYYYWCDKLGILVWQDMPSGDAYIGSRDPDIQRSPESARQFEAEWKGIIDALRNHPSIVMWVPFNEGWGQFDTARIVEFTRRLDPTRLVNHASGWTDRGVGDVVDWHIYPGPGMPPPEEKRASVLGEFGGLGLPLAGHTWLAEGNWGYRSYKTQEELTEAYVGLMTRLRPLIGEGLSAAVYTQTTDVEIEVNGLMTYDRAVLKMDAERAREAHRKLFLPPPFQRWLLPAADTNPQEWRTTTASPGDGWEQPGFDDHAWSAARAGFGTEGTPGARVGTPWDGGEIWLRQGFYLGDAPQDAQLWVHHDEDAEVYLNGVLAAELSGYTTSYEAVPIAPEARAALKTGGNTIAIHCRQTGGGQYIDAGLVQIVERGK
ncbi:MAG: hypothetical protein EYC70_10000 [Planctomycetota bacterium]|nr:MAG: hypothetical protein EYC70_10000 [Planctomycetota bacterium]